MARTASRPALHGQRRTATVLDGVGLQNRPGLQAFGLHPSPNLVGLATQADHQHGGKIGMAGVTGQRAAQQLQGLTLRVHRATGTVGERHHAVHLRVIRQGFGKDVAAKAVGDGTRHRGRTVHRGQDADVIAGRHTAIAAHNAHEAGGLRHQNGGAGVERGALGGVAREVGHAQVVHMHMLAPADRLGGKTDDLAVTAHRRTSLQIAHRHFVARRNQAADSDALLSQHRTGHQLLAGDDHIVIGVQADGDSGAGNAHITPRLLAADRVRPGC